MSKIATYVYCLLRVTSPSLAKVSRGLPGTSKPRALDAGGGLWLIVADAPLERYDEDALARGLKDLDWVGACALAHERVVEHFLDADAVVPMKLFTLFSDDTRALAFVGRDRKRLAALLKRLGGRVEMGVRFRLDEKRAARENGRRSPSSGTAFLTQKLAAQKERAMVRRLAATRANEAHAKLAKNAEAAVLRPLVDAPSPKPLLLDAVYLVPRARAGRFRKNAESLAETLATTGVDLALTGPWPPYNFV